MHRRFTWFAWSLLVLNLFVVLWGAVVRATGSGAGCGEHWPLCNGEVVPLAASSETAIEFTHRISSGLDGILVIALVVFAFRLYPKGHPVRWFSGWSLVLVITEGLIGAALVLLGHVAENQSAWRGLTLSIHLINTLFLLGALACTAWWSRTLVTSFGLPGRPPGFQFRRRLLVSCAVLILIAGVTGAIAALGDTLFRTESLAQGLQDDLSESAHVFVRLRVLHPFLAAGLALLLVYTSTKLGLANDVTATARRLGFGLLGLTITQTLFGAVNLWLLAPVWSQLVHLLLADLLWICFLLFKQELEVPFEAPNLAGPETPPVSAAVRVA